MGEAGSGGSVGSDGHSDAGVGGSTNTDGGGRSAPKPSAGCGKSGRPAGGTVTVDGDHIYTFPAGYDGNQPFPLLVGFHAASNPIDQILKLTNGSDFEKNYVRAFPKSAGTAWDYNTDMKKVLAMYDDLMASYCIDASRVFATGHSSGAQLIVQILTQTHKSDGQHMSFKAVAPVAASNYGALAGPMPVMYIQGKADMVRMSSGADTVARFTTANGCMTTSKPYTAAPICMSSGKTVNDGCIEYDGCMVPTIWCSHDDPQYSNTSHGWPCFATKSMYDFFEGLP
jgi:predicted esterase